MRLQIQAITESDTYKGFIIGSKFKVVKTFGGIKAGSFYFFGGVLMNAKPPEVILYKMKNANVDIEDKNALLPKFDKIYLSTLDEVLADGSLVPYVNVADASVGDIDINDIKDIVKNLDIPQAIGKPINQIVKSSRGSFVIDFGYFPDKANLDNRRKFVPLIVKALKNRNIRLDVEYSDEKSLEDVMSGKISALYIPKIQTQEAHL